ncbi:DUF58 domain-containing protein [Paenirhodobacter enshiensis]|uniref:DUF58 domain-containing protein n=1 Tax=Paenirhodobacter enshiensis TaxID=1105367 RepID=UPI000567C294|nr:DUF58 domain-containing protein [Paenirhodobacter enshiensis]
MTPLARHRAALDLRRRAYEAGAGALPALLVAARQLAETVRMGGHGRRRPGAGDDFWQYRLAQPGDPARMIDWRRSARSDAAYVRDREWQVAQALYLWADDAASMRFSAAPGRPEKAARARLLALALAVLAIRAGERVGLAQPGAPARPGRAQLMTLAGLLARTMTQGAPVPETSAPEPAVIAAHSRAVFLSDFLSDPAPVEAALAMLSGRGVQGVLLQILDPAEEDFPYDGRTVFEAMSGGLRFETREARDLRARYLDRLAERRERLSRAAMNAGWQFSTHRTDAAPQSALLWLHAALERGV